MGHELSWQMKASDTAKELHRAAANRITQNDLLHHSDRGSQYCSDYYQQALATHHITPSMTDRCDCYQNALAASINGVLNQEFLTERCQIFDELKKLVDESVDTYNRYRPHLSLGMKTPDEVHKKASCSRNRPS
jgi:putative transposase